MSRYLLRRAIYGVLVMLALSGCVTTSMQGYADLQPPAAPLQHIAVIAPPALVSALSNEAAKRAILLEDANTILPPTRQYTEADVRKAMADHSVDGVLVVNVTGDTGVRQQYAGAIVNTDYSGVSSGNAMVVGNMIYGNGTYSGSATTTATPVYRYSRTVGFQARLSDPRTSRNYWVGTGTTKAGGSLFMADATSAADAAASIFNDLQSKGLIGVRQLQRRLSLWSRCSSNVEAAASSLPKYKVARVPPSGLCS
jgi:hypothetical protein